MSMWTILRTGVCQIIIATKLGAHDVRYHLTHGEGSRNTGIMPTALVAIEQCFPKSQRINDHPLAARMLPLGARMVVRLLRLPWMRDWLIGLSEKNDPGI